MAKSISALEARALLSSRPKVVELFSGVGGLGLGLEQAGFHIALASEIDEVTGRYAQYNFPATKVLFGETNGDVRRLTVERLNDAYPGVTKDLALIAGGPPCQGFSIAGRKKTNDPLNSLVGEFARVVMQARPCAFIMENVPGILRGDNSQLSAALKKLSRGYQVHDPTQLTACDFGVPQARRRIIVIGIRKDIGIDPSLPSPTHRLPTCQSALFGDLPSAPTVWEAISDLPDVDAYEELIDADRIPYDKNPDTGYQKAMRDVLRNGSSDLSLRPVWDKTVCTNSRRTRHGETLLVRLRELEFGQSDRVSGIRRLHPCEVATTIRAGSTKDRGSWSPPRPLHPYSDRVVTTRESCRIQSFPDYFFVHPTKWHGGRMIGNAVPPLLARAIGEHLLALLGRTVSTEPLPRVKRDESLVANDIASAADSGLSGRNISQTVIHPDKHGLPIGPRSRIRFRDPEYLA